MHYRVGNLRQDQVRQAFSLVQAAHPRLSFEAWRRYARPRVETGVRMPRRGILCLEDRHGCILALFSFRAEAGLDEDRVLHCDYLAAVDLLNPREALGALIQDFQRCAQGAGCHTIRVAAPRAHGTLSAALVDHGYRVDWVGHALEMDQDIGARPRLQCI